MIRFSLKILVLTTLTLAFAVAAQAQATRTWVSGVGDDVNPCSRTAPCKTFAGAISKTFINGEIDALDPGGFGTVTITKSIKIDGGSAFASILASGTNGVNINIAVNANDPLRKVVLRRLSFNGTGASGGVGTITGIRGINATNFSELYVENCYIQNFTTVGIDVAVNQASPVVTRVSVKDTNLNNTGIGIQTNNANGGGFVSGVYDKVRLEKMSTGLNSKDRSFNVLRDSIVTNCSTAGVGVNAPSNSNFVSLESSYIFSATTGVAAGGPGTTVDLSNSSISQNFTGITSGGATVNSHGNNQIFNNTAPGIVPTIVGQQ